MSKIDKRNLSSSDPLLAYKLDILRAQLNDLNVEGYTPENAAQLIHDAAEALINQHIAVHYPDEK